MFRRFGTPFASDWIAKNVNGYVYTAAIPATPALRAEATEYQAPLRPARAARRASTPADRRLPGLRRCPTTPRTSSTGGGTGCARRSSATSPTSTATTTTAPSCVELAVLLEDAIDIHDRHWKIHWMLNFAQFSSTLALNAAVAEAAGEADHRRCMGRLQSSTSRTATGTRSRTCGR